MSGKQISLFKSLPEQELQTYITQIQVAKAASNGLFDATAAQNYATAIQGLEAKQAALLLSTQGLTNAQIAEALAVNESNVAKNYQAMADAGLLARKQKLTVAQVQENLQTVLGAEADTSAAMASLGLSASIEGQEHQTVQLTAKKLKEAVATNVLTEAQAQEFAMRTGIILSMEAQAASTLPKWIATIKAATVAVWDQVKATAVWLATTPAGWATAAIAAIGGMIFAYSKLTKSTEEANEATKEAIGTFESLSSEVENLENKLSDLNEQIGKLDPITNEKDLENLKAETVELETQLAILREKQRIAGDEADKAAQESLGMTQASRYKTAEYESAYGGIEITAAYVTKDEELLNAIEAYEEYKIKVDEANKALADMAETGGYTQKEWREQEEIVSIYSEKVDGARSHLQEKLYDLAKKENQKTALVYTEKDGVIYRQDTKEIREAREAVTEAKENIQIAGLEKDISGLNDVIDGLDKKIKESNKYYDELIEQTEKYWDSLIKGLEEYKSRWQELADIEEQAKMEVMLRNLGITTEDVLNMSESAFESFKGTYLGLLDEIYADNDEMLDMLQKVGGIATDTLKPLSGTIDTVAESLDNFASSTGNANTSTSETSESVGNLSTNTAELNKNLSGVSDTMDGMLEDGKLETIAEQINDVAESVLSVSDALNDMPTDIDMGGNISQFDALGKSVEKATVSVSGGNVSKAEPNGLAGKNMPNTQNKTGNGSNNLVSSIKEIKSETDKSIGTGEGSGAIGQFNQLSQSVTDVTDAISGNGGGSDNLISSIENLGETTAETLGEPDGDGAISKFGEFGDTVAEAENHVTGIIDGMNELDGMTAECSIAVNIKTRGSIPQYAEGTAIDGIVDSMNLNSSEHKAKYEGRAHYEGTANVSGNWGVSNPGRSLVGEVGQELWIHSKDGTFETVGDNGPEFINTEKGDLIFNHLQTQELLSRGNLVGRGKVSKGRAYIDGTNDVVVTSDGQLFYPIQPGDKGWDLVKAGQAFIDKWKASGEEVISNVFFEGQKQLKKWTKEIINNTAINNITNNRNVQQPVYNTFNITMPNVNNATSADALMRDLQLLSTKKYQVDWNK